MLLDGNGGLTASRGIEQTYSTAIIDTVTGLPHRNVLKHEFGAVCLDHRRFDGDSDVPRKAPLASFKIERGRDGFIRANADIALSDAQAAKNDGLILLVERRRFCIEKYR